MVVDGLDHRGREELLVGLYIGGRQRTLVYVAFVVGSVDIDGGVDVADLEEGVRVGELELGGELGVVDFGRIEPVDLQLPGVGAAGE